MQKNNWMLVGYSAIAIIISLATFYFIFLCYHMGPFRDMWIAMDFIHSFFQSHATLSDLFSLHGGAHRLAVPRIFFLLEYGLFSGSNIFLMLSAVFTQFSVVYLLCKLVHQEPDLFAQYRWFLVAMAAVLMFNATQLENFIYTFDMQWFLTSAAAVWALAYWIKCISMYADKKIIARLQLVFAACATSVSLFSSFSGLCILLVLPFLMLAYRLPRKQIAIATAGVVLIVIAYLSGPFSEVGGWGASNQMVTTATYIKFLFSVLWVWMTWVALYFGSPLGREYFWMGSVFAYGSLAFLSWNWLRVLKNGVKPFTQFQLFCLSIALFAAIVGIATGLGRMYFINTADEDRYQSIVAIYWLGIFGFALSQALNIESETKNSRFKIGVLVLIVFWTCLVIPLASLKDARAQINFFDRVNNTNLAIATGQWEYSEIKDTLILGDKWKKENRPERYAPFLREKSWGIFASSEFSLLGQTLDLTLISADACEGGVYSIDAVKEPYRGFRLRGNGFDVIDESLPKTYLVINDRGQVIGLGRLQRQKDSLLPITWQMPEQAQWLAYTVDVSGPTAVRVLGARSSGGYCVMASAKLPSEH